MVYSFMGWFMASFTGPSMGKEYTVEEYTAVGSAYKIKIPVYDKTVIYIDGDVISFYDIRPGDEVEFDAVRGFVESLEFDDVSPDGSMGSMTLSINPEPASTPPHIDIPGPETYEPAGKGIVCAVCDNDVFPGMIIPPYYLVKKDWLENISLDKGDHIQALCEDCEVLLEEHGIIDVHAKV